MSDAVTKVQAAVQVKHTITVTQAANIGLGIALGLVLFSIIFVCGLGALVLVVTNLGIRL